MQGSYSTACNDIRVVASAGFGRELKKLYKKHPDCKPALNELINKLELSPKTGKPLGKDCYKIRFAVGNKGKSGSARLITHLEHSRKIVHLVAVYLKSDKETVTDKELNRVLNNLELDAE